MNLKCQHRAKVRTRAFKKVLIPLLFFRRGIGYYSVRRVCDISITEIIETYLKGWKLGDGKLSLTATADGFHYDDPNTERIQRHELVQFVNDFKSAAVEMGAEENANPFLIYSDVVIDYNTNPVTVWCWWQPNGTDLQGSALIKVGEAGVLYEKIAYFLKLS
ncbi:MAG: hypothetical protein ACJA0I_001352 [Gammaproteobacteria bacterium]|jgi:hypothetical protein